MTCMGFVGIWGYRGFSHCTGSIGLPSIRSSKYSAGGPAGDAPTRPTSPPVSTMLPVCTDDRAQIAVERVVVGAVVENHQGAEAGERIGVGDRPAVDGADRQFLGRGDLDAVSDGAPAEPAFGLSEPAADPPGGRPVERAAERKQRNGDGVRATLGRAGRAAAGAGRTPPAARRRTARSGRGASRSPTSWPTARRRRVQPRCAPGARRLRVPGAPGALRECGSLGFEGRRASGGVPPDASD